MRSLGRGRGSRRVGRTGRGGCGAVPKRRRGCCGLLGICGWGSGEVGKGEGGRPKIAPTVGGMILCVLFPVIAFLLWRGGMGGARNWPMNPKLCQRVGAGRRLRGANRMIPLRLQPTLRFCLPITKAVRAAEPRLTPTRIQPLKRMVSAWREVKGMGFSRARNTWRGFSLR